MMDTAALPSVWEGGTSEREGPMWWRKADRQGERERGVKQPAFD